jgi:hypothetical protein
MTRSDARFVTIAAAVWLMAAGLRWGTFTASGADAYGYVSQASLWLRGDLVVEQPLAREVPWPDADWTFSPLGYRPGPHAGTIVPVYPPGLPVVMALFQWAAGPRAVYYVVPMFGAMAIVAVAAFCRRLSTPTAGAFAALLLAMSPTMLFSVMWPMSDVPAVAWWTLAMALAAGVSIASAAAAGIVAACAILTRPNLVVLAIPITVYLMARVVKATPPRGRPLARLAAFGTLSAAGAFGIAAVHTWLYGSPLQSGHGDLMTLYRTDLVSRNVSGFILRPWIVEPAMMVLATVGVVAHHREERCSDARRLMWVCFGVVGLVLLSYTFYLTYPDWWYLRYLLPAYPAVAVFGGIGAEWIARRSPGVWRPIALVLIAVAIIAAGLAQARARGVFRLFMPEARYAVVGRYVAEKLPANAIFLTFQHSSSLRYYTERTTVRYDLMAPEWLENAIVVLRQKGYRPYLVVEEIENGYFRDRFQATTPLAHLDWPPVAELRAAVGVRIFDPTDRSRWLAGERVTTEAIVP